MPEQVAEFTSRLADYAADRPERLDHTRFSAREPEELLYDEIEAIWARIDEADDWSAFDAKIETIREMGAAWGLAAPFPPEA
jgi:hypothetical protein